MNDVRENLSWQRFGEASRELATVIAADGFEPDLILSIARGGLFLAGSLGYALAVKNLYVMNVEFYDGVGTTLDMPVMLPPVPSAVDFSAKKVLIADDVADTGRTLELVHTFIKDQVDDVRTAVIYEKPQSVIKCDYVWRRTDRWINFPWSCEDPVVQRAGQVLDAWAQFLPQAVHVEPAPVAGGPGLGSVDDRLEPGIGLVERLGESQVADDGLVEALSRDEQRDARRVGREQHGGGTVLQLVDGYPVDVAAGQLGPGVGGEHLGHEFRGVHVRGEPGQVVRPVEVVDALA